LRAPEASQLSEKQEILHKSGNEEQEDVRKTIKKLPKSHQKLVKSYKFKFQKNNTLNGDHDHIGENDEDKKIITVCAPWNYGREFTLLHEIGHLVWTHFMTDALKDQWKKAYEEAEMLKKDRQNPEEIFCHAYAATFSQRPPMAYYKPKWVKLIKTIN